MTAEHLHGQVPMHKHAARPPACPAVVNDSMTMHASNVRCSAESDDSASRVGARQPMQVISKILMISAMSSA